MWSLHSTVLHWCILFNSPVAGTYCTVLIAVQIQTQLVQVQGQEIFSQDSEEHCKVVLYYSMICPNAALCQLSMYLFVLGIPKYLQVCTKMYPVCILKKNKLDGITLGIEQQL